MYGNHPRILAVSLFSQCVDIEQNARGTQMTTRVTEGARQDRRVSRLFSCVSRACTPLTKSEGKERLLAAFNHPESGKFLLLESPRSLELWNP